MRRQRQEVEVQEEDLLLSDVHIGTAGGPNTSAGSGSATSRFSCFPDDADPDYKETLTIVHSLATPLSLVGLQVWSGAFLLADFLLQHADRFRGCTALELGCGPGVAGLTMARVARRCYLTDAPEEVLCLLQRNIEANRHLFQHDPSAAAAADGTGGGAASAPLESPVARARKLDWFQACGGGLCSAEFGGARAPFEWRAEELRDLGALDVVLASDVVYDEDMVAACFDTLALLMPPTAASAESGATAAGAAAARRPTFLLALEKRFNFSLAELSVVATGYRALLSRVHDLDTAAGTVAGAVAGGSGTGVVGGAQQKKGGEAAAEQLVAEFEGRRLPLADVPQRFPGYTCTPQMELWEIWRR